MKPRAVVAQVVAGTNATFTATRNVKMKITIIQLSRSSVRSTFLPESRTGMLAKMTPAVSRPVMKRSSPLAAGTRPAKAAKSTLAQPAASAGAPIWMIASTM